MGPMEESWQNYERQRRRLNARLGLMVFALLPLPAILIAVGLSPLRMLLVVASLGVSIGILYPMWWRTKHNPLRASVVERRTRRIAWICRPSGFLCGLAAMLSWSVGSEGCRMGCFGIRRCGRLVACGSRISPTRKQSKSCDPRPVKTELKLDELREHDSRIERA